VDLFYYVIDELTTIVGQIFCDNDTSECDNIDKLDTKFKYDSSKSIKIINHLVSISFYCPKIFKQLLIDINNIDLISDIINKLVFYNYIEYVVIIFDYLGSNIQKFIDEIFLYATSIDMIDLLIDYGADYEKIYRNRKFHKLREDIIVHIKKLIKSNKN
jgi:DNA integrity scanning protein DisA with diadenylate cyclase activity